MSIRLGVHVSIAGGFPRALVRARKLGINSMQIFSRSPRTWSARQISPREIESFRTEREHYDIYPIAVHTPYLLNLASSSGELYEKSIRVLSEEMKRASLLGAEYVVTHPGNFKGGTRKEGLRRIGRALKKILPRFSVPPTLLLENTSGGGSQVGGVFGDFAEIFKFLDKNCSVGICLDSCHAFAAGYDIRTLNGVDGLMRIVKRDLGPGAVKLIHLNDSEGDLDSHKDRHAHIGAGMIGIDGFRNFLAHSDIRKLPLILETPREGGSDDMDNSNLNTVRELLGVKK
jgi:deoxyribonuclease-4